MEIAVGTFEAVALMLAIGVVGFWIISRRVLPRQALGILSPLALEVALPCLVFANIVQQFDPAARPRWWAMPLYWAAFTVGAILLSRAGALLADRRTRREFRLSLLYQNAIFFPLVILTELYGAESDYVTDLFLFTLFFPPFIFITYRRFLGRRVKIEDWRKIVHPVLIAVALGLAARGTGLHAAVPEFAVNALARVGAMSAPILMLILGGNIYVDFKRRGNVRFGEIVKFVAVKNVAFPLIAIGVIALLRPPKELAMLLLLQSAAPPITSVPILIGREGGDAAIASQLLLGSFLAAVLSIPLMMYLLTRFVV